MELTSNISAVVTGGASGLGLATAKALAAKGVKVAIFDLQEEKGLAAAEEIGGIFCEVNVTDDASVDAGFEKARAAHGQERILVNCAGVGNAMKTVSRSYRLAAGKDAAEGVQSFIDKRPANFQGRVSSDMPDFYPWWEEPDYR